MNQNKNSLSYLHCLMIFAALVFACAAVFHVSYVTAKTGDVERPVAARSVSGPSSAPSSNFRPVRNGKIAFERNAAIYTVNQDGTVLRNHASGSAPSWSPDGSTIVFDSFRDGNYEIYKMNADGSNQVRLTNNPASDTSPHYSPDGSTIVFSSQRDGNPEIYKMNADGSNQVRLTNDPANQGSPVFSPDGKKILYISGVTNTSNPNNLYTMNPDGSDKQPIPGPSVSSQVYQRPSYSPDGSKIMFTYSTDFISAPPKTFTMNADGTGRGQFHHGQLGSYSPDGTQVVYTNVFGPAGQIYEVLIGNSNGSFVRAIAPEVSMVGRVAWQPLPQPAVTAFDFDGDGRSDVSVFRPSDGVWHLLRSQAGYAAGQWGLSTDVLVPGDYDGDSKADIAVWRPSQGVYYILNSFNGTVRIEYFGMAGDVPAGGDWDGDGKADLAVFRGGAQGVFYYRGSLSNPQGSLSQFPWGTTGDKVVAGDYDGDGITDAAIFRPSNGVWYIRQSSNGQLSAAGFGLADDVLVPADYDGDGRTDIAVYRGGIWYILRSAQSLAIFQFGAPADIPVPADYDGDGKSDAAVFRNGAWWTLRSQTGSVSVTTFGTAGDAPVPSAFVR